MTTSALDVLRESATGLARAIRAGGVSSREVVALELERALGGWVAPA